MTAPDLDVDLPEALLVPKRRRWVTPALLGAVTFALSSLFIRGAAQRQAPILDSMELQPFASAATLAYAWGSAKDAEALERQVLALAERQRATAETPSTVARGEPNFDALRRMDADTAKFRLAVLADAPHSTFAELCARASIRCTPYTLDALVNMFKKQRMVHDAP